MKLNLILNRDENDIIGIDDELPYHIQDDFNWFQEKTLHNIVVMGYNTWKSLPKKPNGSLNDTLSVISVLSPISVNKCS